MGTSSPVSAPDSEWDGERLKAWIVDRSRPLLIGASVIVVGVAVVAFWKQSTRIKSDKAETAFASAQGTYYSGNPTLAKSNLEALVPRYPGTAGGTQGAMLLAEILYGEGKFDDGIKQLTSIQGSAPEQFGAAIEELIANGYSDNKRPADAADHFLKAADKARFPSVRDSYLADAARVLTIAGKKDQAHKIWEQLVADPESPVNGEARVRLGEMDAKPAAP